MEYIPFPTTHEHPDNVPAPGFHCPFVILPLPIHYSDFLFPSTCHHAINRYAVKDTTAPANVNVIDSGPAADSFDEDFSDDFLLPLAET